jgi:hypothetical protein
MNIMWGDIKPYTVEDASDFWSLYDELRDDSSNFLCNRNSILEAYMNGTLYGLRVTETDEMYHSKERENPIFCKGTLYCLPCFCIKDDTTAVIIWVHTRARRKGFGKSLVNQLGITKADTPLPTSIPFWEACGIHTT